MADEFEKFSDLYTRTQTTGETLQAGITFAQATTDVVEAANAAVEKTEESADELGDTASGISSVLGLVKKFDLVDVTSRCQVV